VNDITIILTRVDYFLAQLRMHARHPVNIGAWLALSTWVTFMTLRGRAHTGVAVLLAVALSLVVCAILFLVVMVIVSIAMALLSRAERGLLGEHVYRLTEAGLVESTHVNEGLLKWGGARSLVRTRRYIYVRVTFSMFHAIPRRYFADEAADDFFWNALQPLVAKKVS
jgi:hypothetical protein